MAITFVASVSASGAYHGGTSAAINTTGATMLVVSTAGATGNAPAFSDNKGNLFVPLTAQVGSGVRQQFHLCANPNVGTGHTFSSGGPSFNNAAFTVMAFAGPMNSMGTLIGAVGTASPLATGSLTPALADSLVITGLAGAGGGTVDTPPAGFTGLPTIYNGNAADSQTAAYQIQTAATAVNPEWSWTGTKSSAATQAVVLQDSPSLTNYARVSQAVLELATITDAPNPARLSQAVAELLTYSNAPNPAYLSQAVAEVLTLGPSLQPARLSQAVLEILVLPVGGEKVSIWID